MVRLRSCSSGEEHGSEWGIKALGAVRYASEMIWPEGTGAFSSDSLRPTKMKTRYARYSFFMSVVLSFVELLAFGPGKGILNHRLYIDVKN
jgi:hypothetical protein